jgi:hypothetical protein
VAGPQWLALVDEDRLDAAEVPRPDGPFDLLGVVVDDDDELRRLGGAGGLQDVPQDLAAQELVQHLGLGGLQSLAEPRGEHHDGQGPSGLRRH